MATLIDILNKNAGNFCNKPVLRYKSYLVPYSEILDVSDKFAQGLRNLQFDAGDNIAIFLPNIPEMFTAYYGCLKARCRVILLSILQRTYDIKYILEKTQVKGLIFGDIYERKVVKILDQIDVNPKLICVGRDVGLDSQSFHKIVEASESINISEYPAENDTAVILFSSGTVGNPKGAVLTHANILASTELIVNRFSLTSKDKIIGVIPANHYLAQAFFMNAALFCGAEVILHSYFKPEDICEFIRQSKPTIFIGNQPIYQSIMDLPETFKNSLASLRFCIVTGLPIKKNFVADFQKLFNVEIIQSYGCVETTSIIAATSSETDYSDSVFGKPFPDINVKIVDEKKNELLPGEIGEIAIKGPMNMKGYYDGTISEDKQEKFEWVYPGDTCMWDEKGNIKFINHKEETINKGHFPVYPVEVESCILQHPAVQDVVVKGIKDHDHIEEIKAFVVLKKNETVEDDEIIRFCNEKLPKYKCPKYVEFVDSLPKNISGYVVRRFLK